jgi:hypothetical protein
MWDHRESDLFGFSEAEGFRACLVVGFLLEDACVILRAVPSSVRIDIRLVWVHVDESMS